MIKTLRDKEVTGLNRVHKMGQLTRSDVPQCSTQCFHISLGSGCGSVGRPVASDTRDPDIRKTDSGKTFIYQLNNAKDENKIESENGPSSNKLFSCQLRKMSSCI